MTCDVRKLPDNQILPLMRKLHKAANKTNCDIKHDEDWFININWDNFGSDWKMTSQGRGSNDKVSMIWVSYYPPNGGNVRFDFHVCYGGDAFGAKLNKEDTEEVLRLYNDLLVRFGHAGKNDLTYFESLPGLVSNEPCIEPVDMVSLNN